MKKRTEKTRLASAAASAGGYAFVGGYPTSETVQKAYDELAREGLVESRRGAGLFVVDRPSAVGATQTEKRIHRQLSRVIADGLRKRIAPERIRTLFREALDSQVAATTRSTP